MSDEIKPTAEATPATAIAATPEQAEALERIKQALAECPVSRGSNWLPVKVPVGPGRKPKMAQGYLNPVIQLYADDICTVCEMVPEAKRDRIVNDLFAGSDEHCGFAPPKQVHIHVDDAYHLADLGSGIDPVPPRQPVLSRPKQLPPPRSRRG